MRGFGGWTVGQNASDDALMTRIIASNGQCAIVAALSQERYADEALHSDTSLWETRQYESYLP